ncbi:MAG: hypothetical protein ABEK17_00240 [Candidatus Aenigmatarchaeota archaeon]
MQFIRFFFIFLIITLGSSYLYSHKTNTQNCEKLFSALKKNNLTPFLNFGSDIGSCRNDKGETLLIKAVQLRNVKAVKILNTRGIDISKKDKKNKNAMDYANSSSRIKEILMSENKGQYNDYFLLYFFYSGIGAEILRLKHDILQISILDFHIDIDTGKKIIPIVPYEINGGFKIALGSIGLKTLLGDKQNLETGFLLSPISFGMLNYKSIKYNNQFSKIINTCNTFFHTKYYLKYYFNVLNIEFGINFPLFQSDADDFYDLEISIHQFHVYFGIGM